MNILVPLLVRSVLVGGAANSQDTDYERQFRRREISADVANELCQQIAVLVIAARFTSMGIRDDTDHVVPTLEPDKASQSVSRFRIVVGIHPFDIRQDLLSLCSKARSVASLMATTSSMV